MKGKERNMNGRWTEHEEKITDYEQIVTRQRKREYISFMYAIYYNDWFWKYHKGNSSKFSTTTTWKHTGDKWQMHNAMIKHNMCWKHAKTGKTHKHGKAHRKRKKAIYIYTYIYIYACVLDTKKYQKGILSLPPKIGNTLKTQEQCRKWRGTKEQ